MKWPKTVTLTQVEPFPKGTTFFSYDFLTRALAQRLHVRKYRLVPEKKKKRRRK